MIVDYTAIVVGLVGAMTALTAAGYIRATLAEIDPGYQAPPSKLEGPILGDIFPALHYWKLRRAAASVIFFVGAALVGLALLMQVLTSWG